MISTYFLKNIDEIKLCVCLKKNLDWLCPNDFRKCWLYKFFKEFERTFSSNYMTFLKKKSFRCRFYKR